MKSIVVDKIASVAQHNEIGAELRLSADIPCEEGVLVAVRVLNNKSTLQHARAYLRAHGNSDAGRHRGRRARPPQGAARLLRDICPTRLRSATPSRYSTSAAYSASATPRTRTSGRPSTARCWARSCISPSSANASACRRGSAREPSTSPRSSTPGACPSSRWPAPAWTRGKTAAACAIVSRLRHIGYAVSACKATGVSLRRDIHAMEDAGARETMIFSDLGDRRRRRRPTARR